MVMICPIKTYDHFQANLMASAAVASAASPLAAVSTVPSTSVVTVSNGLTNLTHQQQQQQQGGDSIENFWVEFQFEKWLEIPF